MSTQPSIVVAILILLSAFVRCQDVAVIKAESDFLGFTKGFIDFLTWKCNSFNPLRASFFESFVTDRSLNVLVYHNSTFVSFPMTNASDSMTNSTLFDINAKTLFFVHGFNGFSKSERQEEWGRYLKQKGNYNFLTLDSSAYLSGLDYVFIAGTAPYVGKQLFEFISELYEKGMLLSNFHLVGQSLGAQISGYAGRLFKQKYGVSLSRITALDPATPCFDVTGLNAIAASDADFVDVIRTSFLSYKPEQQGHADYYVQNRKGLQLGCGDWDIFCSHVRSVYLFAESIKNDLAFVAKKCNNITVYDCNVLDVSIMGLSANPATRGTYFLKTNKIPPYSMGIAGIL